MKHNFRDITDRIEEKPTWWDDNGVPRYCKFHPGRLPNIYAHEAALLLVKCQNCLMPYEVSLSAGRDQRRINLDYGDPPNAECCPAGLRCAALILKSSSSGAEMNARTEHGLASRSSRLIWRTVMSSDDLADVFMETDWEDGVAP